MTSVRRLQKLCWTEPLPVDSKVDQLLAKTEPNSAVESNSAITHLRKWGKKRVHSSSS